MFGSPALAAAVTLVVTDAAYFARSPFLDKSLSFVAWGNALFAAVGAAAAALFLPVRPGVRIGMAFLLMPAGVVLHLAWYLIWTFVMGGLFRTIAGG